VSTCEYCEEVEQLLRVLAARQKGTPMKEAKDLAQTMRASIAKLKQSFADASNQLSTEVAHSQATIGKVQSLTSELKQANKEVETELGIGSNFPTSSETISKPDLNGVTKGGGTKPDHVDEHGVEVKK
jgi:hypothetical protein